MIGVTGPWGSGKTSILHLLARQLADEMLVVRFDPWLFSSADQLVTRFFAEVARVLENDNSKRMKKLGRRLADYGAALSPAAGILVGPAAQLLAVPQQLGTLNHLAISEQRERLRAALRKDELRIVVLIDDIDRLDDREVGEIMRLVKLVADLPRIVHVLSYDRSRTEAALARAGHIDGRAYLEKIVQVSVAVPPLSTELLRQMTLEWLQAAIGDRTLVAWRDRAWSSLVDGGIDRYLLTMRDGRRLANVVPTALDLCADEVASMDVMALEAVRVFDPDVHDALLAAADMLTGARAPLDFRERAKVEAELDEAASALLAPSRRPAATRTILRELFPAAAHRFGGLREGTQSQSYWREAKRVAAKSVLLRYMHLSLATSEAAAADVDRALLSLGDRSGFKSVLEDVPDERLDDLLSRVRRRISEQSPVDVVGCALVILRLVPRLAHRRHVLDVDPDRRATWFVQDLVESIGPTDARAAAARDIADQAPTLSLRLSLLSGSGSDRSRPIPRIWTYSMPPSSPPS